MRSSVQNLCDLALEPRLFGVAGVQEFDLDRVKGLGYTYDAARQAIAVRVDDALRASIAVSACTVRKLSTRCSLNTAYKGTFDSGTTVGNSITARNMKGRPSNELVA